MAVNTIFPGADNSTEFFQIEGFETTAPSSAADGAMINDQTFTKINLTDASGTVIGRTRLNDDNFAVQDGTSAANYQYVVSETGTIYRVIDITGGGGTFTFEKADGTTYETTLHTGAVVLEEVTDEGVLVVGSTPQTFWGARPAYGTGGHSSTTFTNGDVVTNVNITNQVDSTSNNFALTDYSGVAVAPCFTAGTLMKTANGVSKVEDLVAGDLVMTKDHGAMPLLWAGATKVKLGANSDNRPVVFDAGSVLGNTEKLTFSPNHAVLVKGVKAEILFGDAEVLVLAKSLVNDKDVHIDFDAKEAHYCHIMFENHEIIYCADGTQTESLFVGAESVKGFGAATKAELLSFFPELAVMQGTAMTPAATTLTPQEAKVLSTLL